MNDELRSYLEEKFGAINRRFTTIEKDIENLSVMTGRSFAEVNSRLDGIDDRLDAIENVHVGNLANRVEKLEDDYRKLVAAVGR